MSKPALRLVELTEPTLDRLIQLFLDAKASRKETTWKFYELPLRQFRDYSGPNSWPPTDTLINSYLAACRRRGLKQNTLYAYYRALKTWLSWLHKRGLIEANPIELVERHQPAGKLPRAPRLKIVQAFFKAISANSAVQWRQLRDLALFHLILDTGLRVGEVANILVTDVDMEEMQIHIPETKTSEERYVVFSSLAAQHLKTWLTARSALPLQANLQSLFVSYYFNEGQWRSFSAGGMREAKDRYFERIGIPAFRLHDLRHAYAIYSLRNGGDILDVQAQLGHKNISTTAIYLRALNDERGKRHEKSSPLTSL